MPVFPFGYLILQLRPHDSLDDLTPVEYFSKNAGNSILQLST